MSAKIITVLNRKGGVGKTTLAIGIADTLVVEHKADTAIIDLDPQATASGILLNGNQIESRAKHDDNLPGLLRARLQGNGAADLNRYIVDGLHFFKNRPDVNLRLYPNSDRFWDLEEEELQRDGGQCLCSEISTLLRAEAEQVKFIIIDCPPGQSRSALAALKISDFIICPVSPDKPSEWGKGLLTDYLKRNVPPSAAFKFVITRYEQQREASESLIRLSLEPDMLRIEGGEKTVDSYPPAVFSESAKVKNRIQLKQQRMLHQIYDRKSVRELQSIVNALIRELGIYG